MVTGSHKDIRTVEDIAAGWMLHDGGACPVHPDTIVGIPASATGVCTEPDGLYKQYAHTVVWEDYKNSLRQEIEYYKVIKPVGVN